MKKSLITIGLATTLIVGGTAIYSANQNPLKNKNISYTQTLKTSQTQKNILTNNSTITNIANLSKKTTTSSSLNNSETYARLQEIVNKTSDKNTAFITNLDDYKIINGHKYYNVYEYYIGEKSKDWICNGNYSNFIGARYLDVDGHGLNKQFNQSFPNKSLAQKKEYLEMLAKQFSKYIPNNSSKISIDMNKKIDFEGYQCYFVTIGSKSFYMTPAGFIYINKQQSFY